MNSKAKLPEKQELPTINQMVGSWVSSQNWLPVSGQVAKSGQFILMEYHSVRELTWHCLYMDYLCKKCLLMRSYIFHQKILSLFQKISIWTLIAAKKMVKPQ